MYVSRNSYVNSLVIKEGICEHKIRHINSSNECRNDLESFQTMIEENMIEFQRLQDLVNGNNHDIHKYY